MQDVWVVEGLENWLLERVWKVWILVRGLVAADEGLEFFLLAEGPVEEGELAVRDLQCAWVVNGGIERKLDTLNQVECDGVLEATV